MNKRVEFWHGDMLVGVREFSTNMFDSVEDAVRELREKLTHDYDSVRMVVKDID